ncbi:concanavalin A-like lectin/glucanase domain-containing protein [Coprinopsis sp. MPI-PUGE-AT-0042]|nr:concanavalin A-like lectin/glucanase domain-containing protein [Coprinopsis sp. MPI-PUGE-AT-0042]
MSDGQTLVPPQRRFAGEGVEISKVASHSRTTSAESVSPPITPRTLTFQLGTTGGPFSPAGSIASGFSPAHTPSASLGVPQGSYFERHGGTKSHSHTSSNSTSIAEFPRNSSSLYGSRPNTADAMSSRRETFSFLSAHPSSIGIKKERPKSTMLDQSKPIEKPWTQTKEPYTRFAYILTYAVWALRCWIGWNSVHILPENRLCPVMDENFASSEGLFGDNGKFFREVDDNGEFEMATDGDENSYVKDGKLWITPTFTSELIGEDAILDGHVFNITGCTFNITQGHSSYTHDASGQPLDVSIVGQDREFDYAGYQKACSAVSNSTAGKIINPVRSARLTTRLSASIRYGRVEVRAKIPTGDWLWPAIWMLPVDNVYGEWPKSGEIDIMEARGNGPDYAYQGTNYVRGSLNWGPLASFNAAYKTYGWWTLRRGSYDQDFHTYALEWDEDFIRIYVDSRLHHMLDLRIKKSFWELGKFPPFTQIGADTIMLNNLWANGTKAAPFDQKFYLILDVGVGGTNGWFPDGKTKPWLDGSQTAMSDFWRAKDQWMPTWKLLKAGR